MRSGVGKGVEMGGRREDEGGEREDVYREMGKGKGRKRLGRKVEES